jgi:hypothetical protein
MIGFDERRAVLMHPVDGNGAAWGQRHPLRANRLALVCEPGDAQEYVGAVGGAHLCGYVRMRGHPVTDALRRDCVACKTRVDYFPPWTIPILAPTTLSVAVRKRFAGSATCRGAAPF